MDVMTAQKFIEYIRTNSKVFDIFMEKALPIQTEKFGPHLGKLNVYLTVESELKFRYIMFLEENKLANASQEKWIKTINEKHLINDLEKYVSKMSSEKSFF
ncbi:hypothetical protein [Leuconostoc pseudomesenteroides]|uniref:hypothetical protein n=1 Tax=Leuconostoc pseudomesenteroides TaxID=33968 RepID=UPI0039EB8D47